MQGVGLGSVDRGSGDGARLSWVRDCDVGLKGVSDEIVPGGGLIRGEGSERTARESVALEIRRR